VSSGDGQAAAHETLWSSCLPKTAADDKNGQQIKRIHATLKTAHQVKK